LIFVSFFSVNKGIFGAEGIYIVEQPERKTTIINKEWGFMSNWLIFSCYNF